MLNAKQTRFCEEYIIDLNGTQAAIRAGYSKKTANRIASELLTKPDIKARIEELKAERSKRTGITADRVLQELALIGFSNITDFLAIKDVKKTRTVEIFKTGDIKDGKEAAISEVKQTKDGISLKLHSKTDALHKIGIHLDMFTQKVQMLDKDGNPTDPNAPKEVDPMAPINLTVNVIKRNADNIQRASGESVLEPEAGNS